MLSINNSWVLSPNETFMLSSLRLHGHCRRWNYMNVGREIQEDELQIPTFEQNTIITAKSSQQLQMPSSAQEWASP